MEYRQLPHGSKEERLGVLGLGTGGLQKCSDDEIEEIIRTAITNGIKSIPCTACHYCTAGCPKKIPIPEIFAARNQQLVWGQLEEGGRQYSKAVENVGRACDCISCGQCERACPQQIDVIARLKDCAAQFDR